MKPILVRLAGHADLPVFMLHPHVCLLTLYMTVILPIENIEFYCQGALFDALFQNYCILGTFCFSYNSGLPYLSSWPMLELEL